MIFLIFLELWYTMDWYGTCLLYFSGGVSCVSYHFFPAVPRSPPLRFAELRPSLRPAESSLSFQDLRARQASYLQWEDVPTVFPTCLSTFTTSMRAKLYQHGAGLRGRGQPGLQQFHAEPASGWGLVFAQKTRLSDFFNTLKIIISYKFWYTKTKHQVF